MKKLIVLAVIMGVLSINGIASAVSIAPSLGVLPVAGEAEFNSLVPLILPGQAYVDWIVFNPGVYGGGVFAGLISGVTGSGTLTEYLYVYQIEARGSPAVKNVENLSIYFNTGLASAAGSYSADLDIWHNSVNFANLATEGEDAAATLEPLHFGPAWSSNNITWDYDGFLYHPPLTTTKESEVAWLTSPYQPDYVFAAINNTSQTGGSVPAPVPEPTSLLLLGSGLLGVALLGVRRRKIRV